MEDYISYTEWIFKQWKNESLDLNGKEQKFFQLNFCPEPYIVYEDGNNPLRFLNTNPGQGLTFQKSENIYEELGAEESDRYCALATRFGKHYDSDKFPRGTARSRIEKQKKLSHMLGFNGCVTIETFPFHSATLPKNKKLKLVNGVGPILEKYRMNLQEYLRDKSMIIVSAGRTNKSIDKEYMSKDPWFKYQLELIGVTNVGRLDYVPLIVKEDTGKVTAAMLYNGGHKPYKALLVKAASNDLPAKLDPVAQALL